MSSLENLQAHPYKDYWICAQMIKHNDDDVRWLSTHPATVMGGMVVESAAVINEELNKQLEMLLMADLNREKESTYS